MMNNRGLIIYERKIKENDGQKRKTVCRINKLIPVNKFFIFIN